MVDRVNWSGGSPWEPLRGFSRAVQVGGHLYISGITATDEHGNVHAAGEPYEQTRYVIDRIKAMLTVAGYTAEDVVRTRLAITLVNRWEEYSRAHRETFESIRPASSMFQIARLADPRLVIEMEVDAVLGCNLIGSRVVKI